MIQRHFLLGSLLVLTGCSGSQSYSIDNPTDSPITVGIDGDTYTIAAHDAKSLSLKAGEHTMRGDIVGDIRFISYVRGRGGIINPTLADYVVMRQSYVPDPGTAKPMGMKPDTVTLDGVEFEGMLEQSHALFIDKNWSYGVDEALPDEVTEHSNGASNTIRAKVFRSKDFIAYFEKEAGATGYFEQNRPKDFKPEIRTVQRPTPPPVIDDPAYESHTAGLRAFFDKYRKATDPSDQEALQKEFNTEQSAFTTATMTLGSHSSPETNQQVDAFSRSIFNLIGSTAVVED